MSITPMRTTNAEREPDTSNTYIHTFPLPDTSNEILQDIQGKLSIIFWSVMSLQAIGVIIIVMQVFLYSLMLNIIESLAMNLEIQEALFDLLKTLR